MSNPTELLRDALLNLDDFDAARGTVPRELARVAALQSLRKLAEHIAANNDGPDIASAYESWRTETGRTEEEGY